MRWGAAGIEVGRGLRVGGDVFLSALDQTVDVPTVAFSSGVLPQLGYWRFSNIEGAAPGLRPKGPGVQGTGPGVQGVTSGVQGGVQGPVYGSTGLGWGPGVQGSKSGSRVQI